MHNGIIENFASLRAELEADGHEMLSETDTEVAAHLLERELAGGVDLTVAMQATCRRLEGAFTLVAVDAAGPRPGGGGPPQLARWSSGSATARTSSAPTWPPSSSTPATRSSSARTRS